MAKAEEYSKKDRELFEETVVSNEEISPGVFLLSVNRRWDFQPGQVVKLAVDRVQPPRIYSICSGNNEQELRVLFNIKEDGYLTPKLAALVPGDRVLLSEPYGGFIGNSKPACWIATGTGIAPFYAMFQSGLFANKRLIHGASYQNQFYFEDELDRALGTNYQRCCSREQSCDLFPGRVTDYLNSLDELPADVPYYLCGKAIMVVDVRDLLIAKGVPYENIIAEIYF
ncbi:ferredoxin--NADP reductase [Mangrovibacterium marinum]|uniref:Ferredoxin--NADP+ reductase n=1 Tax=Mangrovibacterium marinum TaxID=1639118 RepID=A0A2T5C0Z9_9BACT|nr:oxidoreductase [Mangrovibacterium marinum]PTN08306.1 ferredoxin--NADP+ reductase [Mangrovibacterium marinum]